MSIVWRVTNSQIQKVWKFTSTKIHFLLICISIDLIGLWTFFFRESDIKQLNDLLKFVIKRLLDDSEVIQEHFFTLLFLFCFWRVFFDSIFQFNQFLSPFSVRTDSIINPMDLEIMNEKVNDGKYGSKQEFMTDVLWIRHSCFILHKGKFLQ